ncbi:MAG: ParA family protein [Oscillospiraceae bacterium]|nr:ParA family protein [Oscillospiraceae bacterium]
MSNAHKIIAVYGNSGSYKTVTSVMLAKAISDLDGSADIVIVGLDNTKPLLPVLFPKTKTNCSLGKLLSVEYFDQDRIYEHIQMNGKIGVVGYAAAENFNSHASPVNNRIDDFFMQLRHTVNYVIVDCTSDILANKLTAKAVINADEVVLLISCDINGLVWHGSQESILISEQYGFSCFKIYLTLKNTFVPDVDGMKNALRNIAGVIPYAKDIAKLWNGGNAFQSPREKKYEKEIAALAKKILEE